MKHDEDMADSSSTLHAPHDLARLLGLRTQLQQSRDRLRGIEDLMYTAEVDENRGLMLRLRDERDQLELKTDHLENEIYELEYRHRKPPQPAGR
jgi:hypothetical protein